MSDRVNIMRKSVNIPSACRERYMPLDHPVLQPWRRSAVSYSGVSDLAPGYALTTPRPPELMLIATVSGKGWAATPAGRVALEPGSLFIGVPGEPVGWGIDGPAWRIGWWYLRPEGLWRPLATQHGSLRPYPRAGLVTAMLDDLMDRLGQDGDAARDIARLHVDNLLLHLREIAGSSPAAPEDGFDTLWREVTQRLNDPWSVPGMAARLGISPSTLQREAKRRFGRSLHQELIRLRMTRARQVLRSTDYPLVVVAELVGFADPYTFSAAYSRWAGKPPSEERVNRR